MADQAILKLRAWPWMKILAVLIVVVVFTNIAVVFFYFDRDRTGVDRRRGRSNEVSIFRDLIISMGPSEHGGLSDNHGVTVNHSGGQDTLRTKTERSAVPLILWWDPISGMKGEAIHCGQHTCDVTVDRHRWREQEIMVMSFYGTMLSMHDLPVPRGAGDLWALFHDESPKNLDFLYSHQPVMELFNYTATFRSHAHLPLPTQWLQDVNELTSVQYVVEVKVKSQLREEGLAPVVYVQSDCRVPSDRDHFVQLLQQYVDVDCYGGCLNNRRFPNGSSLAFENSMAAMTSEEFYRFLARYKFAIAIENAVCPGYITEKFWRPLQLGVVPVVFGASNIKEFLPTEHSAVVVSDYKSVEEVATVIHLYDIDDGQYSQLLQHKRSGITNTHLQKHLQQRPPTTHYRSSMVRDYQCLLCRKLHQARAARGKGQPLPPSMAGADHYGCPKPGKFNHQGQYEKVRGHWDVPWRRSQAMACLMRNMIRKGTRTTAAAFDAMVDHTVKTWNHSHCQHYFP